MGKLLIIMGLLASLTAVGQRTKVDSFRKLLNANSAVCCDLGFNGYYNVTTKNYPSLKDSIQFLSPLFFFGNGLAGFIGTGTYGYDKCLNLLKIENESNKKKALLNWGTFKIANNEISAMIFTRYENGGPFPPTRLTYYHGYLKNKDTIVNWRVVPPYPKIRYKFEQFDTSGRTLVFVEFKEKRIIDSTHAWVNMYRK